MVLTVLKYKKPAKHSLSRDNYKWLGKRLGFMTTEQTNEHHKMLERFISPTSRKPSDLLSLGSSPNWNNRKIYGRQSLGHE